MSPTVDDLIAALVDWYHTASPAAILLAGLMLICAVWVVGLSWWLVGESEWVWWWFRLSRADRKAWRGFLRRG